MENQAPASPSDQPIKTVFTGKDIIKRVQLVTDGVWVDIITNPKASLLNGEGTVLEAIIKGWNLGDENGNVLPITEENIDKYLSLLDKGALIKFFDPQGIVFSDAKKNK